MAGSRVASADPQTTRQYAGHVKHREHLAEQEAMRRERRKARLKAKGKRV
jgi:hypothetical protein